MFTPDRLVISNITQALPAVVTTSLNHNLTTGQVVRINVPITYGMVELNHQLVSITVLGETTFSLQYKQCPPALPVDSRPFAAFVVPATASRFPAEVVPVGAGPTPVLEPYPLVRNETCTSEIDDATANVSTVPIPF